MVKNVKRGYATIVKNMYRVVIPQWVFKYGENRWVYYVCHELAHVTHHDLFGVANHGEDFKAIEDMYLEDFGLKIIRKKVYPKAILELSC